MKIFGIVIFLLFSLHSAVAQETSTTLAKKLQEQFLAAPAVSFNFDLASEGRITIVADIHKAKIRMESPKLTIVSDGKTIWNYDKSANRETIDNVTGTSAFRDPASLFRFSDNYSTRIVTQNGPTKYTLELTPNASIASLFSSAGALQTITLQLQMKKSAVKIVSASAKNSNGTANVNHLTITTLKSAGEKELALHVPTTAKVIDLRE